MLMTISILRQWLEKETWDPKVKPHQWLKVVLMVDDESGADLAEHLIIHMSLFLLHKA